MHYKPTDFHSYLLYSSSHSSHVKNSIPNSQFLRLRRLCSEDFNFSLKSEEMCEFFDKRGYPTSVVEAGHHWAQQIEEFTLEGALWVIRARFQGNKAANETYRKLKFDWDSTFVTIHRGIT